MTGLAIFRTLIVVPLILVLVGSCQMPASDQSPMRAKAATHLAFAVNPATTAAATGFATVAVEVLDEDGKRVTTGGPQISLSIATNPGSGVLLGGTSAPAIEGLASFSTLKINEAGVGYVLGATASGLQGATSSAFSVTVGALVGLAFVHQPTNIPVNLALPVMEVRAVDAGSNTVTTVVGSVVLSLQNSAGTNLVTSTSVSFISGVASFSLPSIGTAATGYQLFAQGPGFSVTSSPFEVY